jgi:hypothetical protein
MNMDEANRLARRVAELESGLRDTAENLVTTAERVAKLEAALREYGWHKGGCAFSGTGNPESCNCGFLDALAGDDK